MSLPKRIFIFCLILCLFSYTKMNAQENAQAHSEIQNSVESTKKIKLTAQEILLEKKFSKSNNVLSAPNLSPYLPNGWDDKIVVSNVTGTTSDASTLYSNEDIYIDLAVINNGSAATNSTFYIDLLIDGVETVTWYSDPPLDIYYYVSDEDYNIGKLSAGTHTLQIIADATNAIAESNENDNSYSRTITVSASNPFPKIEVIPTALTINQSENGLRLSKWIDYVPSISKSANKIQAGIRHALGLKKSQMLIDYWKNKPQKKSYTLNKTLTSIDWSSNDSPVKDQGNCGSCWAFGAVALIENLGNYDDLSEQVIVSCASDESNCDGGYHSEALDYFKTTGVPNESCYDYIEANGNCSDKCENPPLLVRINDYEPIAGLWTTIININSLKAALQSGPIAVSMMVPDDGTFDYYTTGIYNYAGGAIPDENGHVVLLVGYNDEQQCFKVKNSWGEGWGENGYFRISYDEVNSEMMFGREGFTASGIYDNGSNNIFTISNIGDADLSVTSYNSNKGWLSVTGLAEVPFNIGAGESQQATVNVDWSQITGSQDIASITIASDDPDNPSVQVQVTAIKLESSILVTSPNGGEILDVGTDNIITWSSSTVSDIKIEYTTDGGSSWLAPIVSSMSAINQSYVWNVPNTPSQQCKIKIGDVSNSSIFDISDNVFSIASTPTITVSTSELFDFGDVTINSNSSAKNYTVSGTNLKSNVVITAPAGFQVSKQSNTGFASSISLSPSGSTLSNTMVYVRFSPTAVNAYDGNISHISTDAVPQYVGVVGVGISETASIEPVIEENIICVGTEFWVEVKIGDPKAVSDLYGVSFALLSDNNKCTYVSGSAVSGDFLGSSPLFFPMEIDSQTVDIVITKTSTPGVNGSGIIAKAKFISSSAIALDQTVTFSISAAAANSSTGFMIPLSPTSAAILISTACMVNVWPGDCNNDGAVSAADLLPVGQYYGLQSQNSNNPGNQWQAYERNPWALDGTSPKRIYADANGDGKINSSDVLPIGLNYGKTHSSSGSVIPILAKTNESESGATPLTYPSLELVGPTEPIIGNTKFTIEVVVGENAEVTDLFGISFKIKCSSTTCNYVENSMKEGPFLGNNLLKFDKKIDEQTVDASITKTAAPGENGKGMIAAFDFISEVSQVVNFSLEDVSATDSQGNEIIFDVSNTSVIVDAKKDEELPNNYSLSQNYPNPFNPSTCIKYQIPEMSFVSLKVYDVIGNEIATLVNDEKSPGTYEVIFDGSNLQSGVYFYSIKSNSFTQTKKLLLLK